MGSQRHAPAALPPEKTRYPLYRRPGGLQGQSGRKRKISPPPGFDPRTVQPVASPHTFLTDVLCKSEEQIRHNYRLLLLHIVIDGKHVNISN